MDEMMDFNKDELRRQLRQTERDQRAALPAFTDAVGYALDPANDVAATEKSTLLGLPDRRGFLKIGGMSFALSAFAVACVTETKAKTQLANTGTFAATPATVVPPNPGSSVVDATLVLTAISIERLAIEAYNAAIEAEWLELQVLKDVANYFRDQHEEHAGLLGSFATDLGQSPGSVKANEFLKQAVVTPAVEAIDKEKGSKAAAQTDTLKLALALEDAAAQTYAKAGGTLTTKVMRQGLMSIGAIEAKHYSLLAAVLEQQVVPFSFEHTTGAASEDALIQPDVKAIPTTAPEAPSTPPASSPGTTTGIGGLGGLGGASSTTTAR